MATNILAALTGSASGGMTIALDALGETYMRIAAEQALDCLSHNGAIVTLLAVCGSTHRESYLDIVMVGIVSALIALVAVIALGSMFGLLRCCERKCGADGAADISSCPVAVFHSIIATDRIGEGIPAVAGSARPSQ